MSAARIIETDQTSRYADFYETFSTIRKLFRFDVRYRCRRLHEVFGALDISMKERRVLDFGFGNGELLASFPRSCEVTGVDISPSAVRLARKNKAFDAFRAATFNVIGEERPEEQLQGSYDVIVSSHTLEHVPNDRAVLTAFRDRLIEGGVLALYVPIEEPDYISFHRRNYSIQSIVERVQQTGFKILFTEGSLYVNGHIWKLITIPSRRKWPVVRHLVDALRLSTLSSIPYAALLKTDSLLDKLGFGARQALVVAGR